MERAADAFRVLIDRKVVGKAVIEIGLAHAVIPSVARDLSCCLKGPSAFARDDNFSGATPCDDERYRENRIVTLRSFS